MKTPQDDLGHRRLAIAGYRRSMDGKYGLPTSCPTDRHRPSRATQTHRVRALSLYTDHEIVDELVHRGTVYGLLHQIDRQYLIHFLHLPSRQHPDSKADHTPEQKAQKPPRL